MLPLLNLDVHLKKTVTFTTSIVIPCSAITKPPRLSSNESCHCLYHRITRTRRTTFRYATKCHCCTYLNKKGRAKQKYLLPTTTAKVHCCKFYFAFIQMMSDAPAHHLFCLLGPVLPDSTSLPEVLCVIQVILKSELFLFCSLTKVLIERPVQKTKFKPCCNLLRKKK